MYIPVTKRKRNTKYGNNIWFRYSSKINRNVYFYSDLEYDHWLLIEINRSIIDFCEQPLHVKEYVGEKYVNTIFDMWTKSLNNKELFIEVKYAAELDPNSKDFSLRSYNQVQSQQLWCEANGYHYEIHTDQWIYSNRLYIKNLRKILPYIDKRKPRNEVCAQKLLHFVSNSGTKTIDTLEKAFIEMSKHQVRELICNLLYDGLLKSNIESCEFGTYMEVWIDESQSLH